MQELETILDDDDDMADLYLTVSVLVQTFSQYPCSSCIVSGTRVPVLSKLARQQFAKLSGSVQLAAEG